MTAPTLFVEFEIDRLLRTELPPDELVPELAAAYAEGLQQHRSEAWLADWPSIHQQIRERFDQTTLSAIVSAAYRLDQSRPQLETKAS